MKGGERRQEVTIQDGGGGRRPHRSPMLTGMYRPCIKDMNVRITQWVRVSFALLMRKRPINTRQKFIYLVSYQYH